MLRGCRRSERSYSTFKVRRGCSEEILLVQSKEQRLRFAGATVRRNPTSKEWWLHGRRRAERSYATFKVRRGSSEEIPLVQGKVQRLRFAGTAMKRYPTPKVRETQVRW